MKHWFTEADTETERLYLTTVNRIGTLFLWANIPLCLLIACVFKTSYVQALGIGSAIAMGPTLATSLKVQSRAKSHLIAAAAMSMSGLWIHLGKGMIELHFHVFVMLALLIAYANPFVLVTATLTIAVHHVGFFFFLPDSIFNYQATLLIVIVHASFVILEAIPSAMIALQFHRFIRGQDQLQHSVQEVSLLVIPALEAIDAQSRQVIVSQTQILRVSEASDEILSTAQSTTSQAQKSAERANALRAGLTATSTSIERLSTAQEELSNMKHDLQSLMEIMAGVTKQTSVVQGITFQTKMLSFNAAIEAARAGIHGKGFAVVADEVGKLSQQSAEASGKIDAYLRESTAAVVKFANDMKVKVQQSLDLSKETTQNVAKLVVEVDGILTATTEIGNAAGEQQRGIQGSHQAIQELHDSQTAVGDLNRDVQHRANEMNAGLKQLLVEVQALLRGSKRIDETTVKASKQAEGDPEILKTAA